LEAVAVMDAVTVPDLEAVDVTDEVPDFVAV
jgi:hypothetical protein